MEKVERERVDWAEFWRERERRVLESIYYESFSLSLSPLSRGSRLPKERRTRKEERSESSNSVLLFISFSFYPLLCPLNFRRRRHHHLSFALSSLFLPVTNNIEKRVKKREFRVTTTIISSENNTRRRRKEGIGTQNNYTNERRNMEKCVHFYVYSHFLTREVLSVSIDSKYYFSLHFPHTQAGT